MRKFLIPLICLFPLLASGSDVLKPNDLLAICGDSITEQKMYSAYIEDYLLVCQPVSGVQSMQIGWSGEKADGFLKRMDNDVLRFKPRVATTCYGMNDGQYQQLTGAIANAYRDNMTKIVDNFTMNNVRVVVGSPGCVDSTNFARKPANAEVYNKTLAAERDIAKKIAEEKHLPFADVYQPMFDAMPKAKAKYGDSYPVAGPAPDGIHPFENGHVVMAYAFLKAMNVSGDVGTITVDLAAKKATGSDGHAVKSFDNDTVTIESTKYPFCFLPDPTKPDDETSPHSMRGLIEFVPFNQDLNRYTLVLTGAQGNVKITWGEKSKEFPADQLAKGINLAAEFLDNPFVAPFAKVHQAVMAQQSFETPMIKSIVNSRMRGLLPEADTAMERVIDTGTEQDTNLRNAAAKSVAPVTHTIKIEIQK